MRRGDFAAAWEVSDRVLRERADVPCFHLPRHEQWIWNGAPLDGKRVLVRCYHGLGDTVQFIRFLPQLKAIACETIVWAQPALRPLLRTARGIDRLLPLHDGTPDAVYDIDVELMELAHVFRPTLATLPRDVPYLGGPAKFSRSARRIRGPNRAPAERTGGAALAGVRAGSDPLAVGLVWRAGDWDDRRSVPTAVLEPLACVPGVELHVLQQGEARNEWPKTWGGFAPDTRDVGRLAAFLRALDLVIAVDTFPAHLAGALAVPVWLLLHSDPDWRWMLGRDDSPWYPTMHLFRQGRAGEWQPVVAEVAARLGACAISRPSGRSVA